MANKYKDTSPLAMGRQQKGSAANKKQKKDQEKAAVKKTAKPSSITQTERINQKSYGTTTPQLTKKTTAPKKTQSKPLTQTQRINQKNYGNVNGPTSRTSTTARQQTAQKAQNSAAQRRKNAEANNNLKQTVARQRREERAATAKEMMARRDQARQKKMGLAPEDQPTAAQKEAANRAVKNTPALVKKAIKDTIGGHGQTLSDLTELTASSEAGARAKAMKLGYEYNDTEGLAKVKEERRRTVKAAREERERLAKEQEERQREWDEKTKDAGGLEKAYYGAVESGTGMLTDMAVGMGTQAGSLASMFSRTYGTTRGQAEKEGATAPEDRRYALLQAAKEVGTELMFPGAGLAKKAYGRAGASLGEKAASILLKNLKGPSAELASSGARLLGGVVEENVEEMAGWGLDPLIKEYTYGKNVRNRSIQSTKEAMKESSDALRANIQNEDDMRAAAAYLSSGDFFEQTRQSYLESGLSDQEASEVAERMRDYLAASLSGDVDTMAEIEDEISKKMTRSQKMSWDFDELRDTIASTTLLTASTGLPGAVRTSAHGAALKENLGADGIKALAKTAVNFEDPDVSRQARAMQERIESGKELTNTQVYDLQVAINEQAKVDTQREKSARSMADRAIKNENLVTPYTVDRNGAIQLDQETAKTYTNEAKKAESAIKALEKESEGKESLTDKEVAAGSRAIAGFQAGVFTVNDANALNYSNTTVRAAFEAATGVNLSQYVVKNKDGSVNIPATNTATKDALFAMAADNLVKSAQAETANWMDNTKGQVVTQVSARMGAQGTAALQQALDDVDERDRSKYMMTANATDMLYQTARNTGMEWEDVKSEATRMFPSIDSAKLEAMYRAGLKDRDIATDTMRNRQVVMDEALSSVGEQDKSTGQVFVETEAPPKGTIIRTFTEISNNLGVDIHLVDSLEVGENGKQANGQYIDGAIYINVNNAIEKNIGYIFMHEVTHHLKQYAPEQYQELENLVRERWFGYDPSQMQDAIARKIESYAKHGQKLTEDEALEEIIADAAHEFINDPNFAQQVAEEDPTLAKAILNSIRNALRMLRSIFASGTIDDETHMNSLFSEIGILDEAEALWLEAYKQAVKNKATIGIEDLHEEAIKLDVQIQAHHTADQRRIITEYNNSVDQNLMQMFDDIRNGKYVKSVEIGEVSPDMAADILKCLPDDFYKEGFSPEGYKIVVTKGYFEHVEEEHGENGTSDQTMADDKDKARVGYVVNNYDEIKPGMLSRENKMVNKEGKTVYSPTVEISKTVNGTVLVATAIPDTNSKEIRLVSAYINKKKAFQMPDADAPGVTSDNVSDYPSENIISPTEESGKKRFSMDEPIERVRDLIAVHNLKPDDIRNTFDLGGFPMPSIAVTKDSMGHDMYGDITLMFHSDTIDPRKNRANQVFGGDAYTPTFPAIRFKVNSDVSRRISDLYYDNSDRVGYDGMRGLYRYAEGLEDELNSAGGEKELIERAKADTALMRTYLKINDMDVEDIRKKTETKMSEYEVERCEHFIAALGEEKLREYEGEGIPHGRKMIEHRRNWMQDNLDAVKEAYSDYLKKYFEFTDEDIQNELNNSKMLKFSTFVRDALNYLNNGDTTVKEELDINATNEAVKEKAVDNGFEAWVEDLLAGAEEKKGIRNNKDFFTNMGQRRKWEVLHDPVTLENVVKVMKSNLDAGANGLLGANPKGAAQKKYGNLEEIRADEDRLQMLPEEEFKALESEALDKLTEVCGSIYDHNASKFSNTFGGVLNIGEAIAEILNETRTKAGIQRVLTKEYQWRVSDSEMDDIMEAIDAIANVPTGYFEAKPKRAVTFDEVRAAIIPNSLDADIREGLSERGVNMYEYDPETEGDRTEKINQAATDQNLRFSITDSEGSELSPGQVSFFEHSQNRDESGNLKVMLHGTSAEFTEFDPTKAMPGTLGRAFYFSDSASHAGQYGNVGRYYLNLEHPLVGDTHDITRDQLRRFVTELAEDEDYGIENYGYGATVDSVTDSVWGGSDFAMLRDLNLSAVGDFAEAMKIFNRVNGTEYDGIITPIETVAFYPQQIKRTDNLNPTLSKDTRYSITDSDGNELSDGQVEYFKNSEAREQDGRLAVVYHTTNNGGFTIFDPSYSDDNRSLFFTSNFKMSQSYGTNANRNIVQSGDENISFDEFIEMDGPSLSTVVSTRLIDMLDPETGEVLWDGTENPVGTGSALSYWYKKDNSKFLVSVGGEVMNREEFDRWMNEMAEDELYNYKGHGYYACYLNLQDPLIIDCKGSNWDSIQEEGFESLFLSYDGEFFYVDGTSVPWTLDEIRGQYGVGFAERAEDWIETAPEEDLRWGDTLYTWHGGPFDPEVEGHWPTEENTRYWCNEAEAMDYDGVIFRNLRDNGPYGNGNEIGDVYVAFSSNQVKDIRNENPTENPDIRYSIADDDEATSLLAYQDAMDDSYEALEYYERLYDMTEPEAEMYFNTPQDEESMNEFYAALNSDENVPFSDPELEEGRVRIARSKSDFYSSVSARWRETWTTEGEVLELKSVEKQIRELVKTAMRNSNTDAKYRQQTVNRTLLDVREAYQLMKQDRTDIASALLYRSAQNMIGNLEFIQEDESFEEYKEIRRYLHSTKITLDESFWNNETFLEFRKSHFGTLRLAKGLRSDVDKIYQELEEQFPAAFSESERERLGFGDSEEDMLEHIGYVVDQNVKPFMAAYSSEEAAELTFSIAEQLYDIMESGRPIESLGDQLDSSGRRRLEGIYQDMESNEARLQGENEALRSEYDERIHGMKESHRSDVEMLEYQTKMMKARHEEALRDLAERKEQQAEKRIQKIRERQKAKEERRKERQEHKKRFESINKTYNKLVERLVSNTKDSNIPEQYKKELARLLSAFDLQTVLSKKIEQSRGYKAKKTIKMAAIRTALSDMEKRSDLFHVNDAVTDIIEELQSVDGKTIDALSASELEKIDKLLKALLHEFNHYQKVKIGMKNLQAADLANAQVATALEHAATFGPGSDYQNVTGWLDKIFNMDEITPAYMFKQIDPDSSGLGMMWKEIRRSQDRYIKNTSQITDWMNEIIGEYHNRGRFSKKYGADQIEQWRSTNYTQVFQVENGTLALTPAQMMSLYCLSKRNQAYGHMIGAGVVVAPVSFQAKIMSDKKRKTNRALPIILTDADIKSVVSALTPEQIKVADKLQELMSTKMADWGNEASMNVLGIKLFNESDYFPIKSDKAALEKDLSNEQFENAIRNFGFTKAVQPGARNAIMIEDIFDVVTEHCNNMNLYNSYSETLNDFMKVYNKHSIQENGADYSVAQAISHAYSQKATTFIMEFIRDLNGNVSKGRNTGINEAMNTALARAKQASVFANMRVLLQQPTAITRAFAVINPKYLKSIKLEKGVMDEMWEHCPIALWKSWGYYDINMGKTIEDVIMNNGNWLEDAATQAYGAADNVTWAAIWQMVKAEMKDTHPDVKAGTVEYWELCNERMSEIVDFTQVVDSPLHRSHAMRDKAFHVKLATSFMAEPTLTFNMIRDGYIRAREAWKKGDKTTASSIMSKTAAVTVLQAGTVAAAAAIADAIRGKGEGDGDDDSFGGLWWMNFLNNFKDEMKIWNKVYYIKDLTSLAEGWDNANLALQGWKSLFDGMRQANKKLFEGSKTPWWKIYSNLLGGVGYFTGIPFKTLMRDGRAIFELLGGQLPESLVGEQKTESVVGADSPLQSLNLFKSADKKESDTPATVAMVSAADKWYDYENNPITVKDGSALDKMLNHFGINLTKAEKAAIASDQKKKEMQNKADEISGKYADLSGEERDKKIWSAVTTYTKSKDEEGRSFADMVSSGDYESIEEMKRMYKAAGGQSEYFDERVFAESKKAFKKTIKYDPSQEEIDAQEHIKEYLLLNGMEPAELSELAYKSDTAKDMKIAFRLNDKEAMLETLEPLVRAGLSYDDLERLWENRNRIQISSYKGRYKDKLKSTGVYNWPITGSITSDFGHRASPGGIGSTNHQGIDIGGNMGDPVAAADGGVVVMAEWYGGYGKTVQIKHDDGTITQYSHLSWWEPKVGDVVGQGQIIGNVGSTGNSTGPHLHFGVIKDGSYVNPMGYLN